MDQTVSSTTLDLQALTQDAAINPTATSPGDTGHSSGYASGQYASGLMDELFTEVDGILDGSLIPPSEPLKVAPPAEPKAPINLDFAAFLSTPPAERAAMMADLSVHGAPSMVVPQDPEVPTTLGPTETLRIQARQESYGLFEKLLIFVGCSSAIAAMVIWLGSQGTIGRMVAALRGTNEVAAVAPSGASPTNPTDAKFADYMGKSLESIDSKTKTTSGLSNLPGLVPGLEPGAQTTPVLPTVEVPATQPQAIGIVGGSGLPKPKAPAVTPGLATNARPSGLSNVPQMPTALNSTANPANPSQNTLEQTVAKLSNLVDRMSRATAPAPIAPVSAPAVRSMPAPVVAAAPAPERTLKGILGNGDRSAVMFELNGVTKSYEKGEKIGNSGWVLVRVENGNAVVRRNGEVRTLSVGQRI